MVRDGGGVAMRDGGVMTVCYEWGGGGVMTVRDGGRGDDSSEGWEVGGRGQQL